MDSCLYMGLMLVFAACVLVAVFRPQERKGKLLCLLLALMGAMTISFQEDGVFLLTAQMLLGAVMTLCTTGVLLAEVHARRAAKAAKRHAQHRSSARRVSEQPVYVQEERRAA